jgi:alpha-galactosidase
MLPNKRFPDMKALTEYIHGKGLKAGIYTSPGPLTCARFAGSYQHEEADARQFAEWGFDFLKYDWCSYRTITPKPALDDMKAPYTKMGNILKKLDRDVVFNLCQYGMGDVWKWGAEVGGHCWRTTGDLGIERGDRLPGFYHIGLRNAKLFDYAAPGRWNDPDYLIIGYFRDARKRTKEAIPTPLTADEQYSYMSMWALMAAPLFFSGDMGKLDDFTVNVLCNTEVIDVDQDPLGKQARIVRQSEEELVLVKPLEDGSVAVGLFNLSEAERPLAVSAADLGLKGRFRARDLWRQKDVDGRAATYTAKVPRHGVSFVRAR